jgi:hypothetical protein
MSPEELDELVERVEQKTKVVLKVRSVPMRPANLPIEDDTSSEESQ